MKIWLVMAVLLAGVAQARPVAEVVAALPEPEHWVEQARDQLLPWWRQSAALGDPVGRFPTFRCPDGSVFDARQPCAALQQAPAWIREATGRTWVRMQSRQVFAYAVGFHLTGDEQLLRWARAGLDDMRERAFDRATGSPASWHQDGAAGPPPGERTAQDIAYAGLAWSIVYYLTRDPVLLDELDHLHRHLMTYYDAGRGELRWTLRGPESGKHELVAQLDPLNAYMVLTTPLLQGTRRARWEADLRRLTTAIRTRYCAGPGPVCQGTLGQPDSGDAGARHNDFGHSGKSLWMVGLAGRILRDRELQDWAWLRAGPLLRQAYVAETGSWASRWTDEGVDASKSWWIYAELDQLAATLALQDPSVAAWLQYTWPWWDRYLVDARAGEVHGWVSAAGYPGTGLKQHHWKNGYHSLEHALVSTITAAGLKGRPLTLYYGRTAARARVLQPYFYQARELDRRVEPQRVVVRFRLPQPALDGPVALAVKPPLPPLAVSGTRVPLTAARLAALAGAWQGQWLTAEGQAIGDCTWVVRDIGPDHIEADPCPVPGATRAAPLAAPVRLSDGGLQLPGPRLGQILHVQYSENDGQQWLQWVQPVDGRTLTVRLARVLSAP